MKKNTKRMLAFVSAAVIVSTIGLSACGKVKDAEGTFKDYEYNYEQNTLKTKCDADMTIDGVLDEARWTQNELKWLEHKEGENGPYFKFTTVFSDLGVYFAAVSEDWRIYYNAPYSNTKNTCFDMYLARTDDYQLNDKVYVTFDCGGTFWSHGLYEYLGKVTVQGGEPGSDSCTGMTLEAFVPWSQLGLSEKPEEIKAVCQYRVTNAGGTSTAAIWPGYANGTTYGKYFDFGPDGYINADGEYGILGDSKTGYSKTYNWDVSRAEEDIYKTNRTGIKTNVGQAYIFYRDVLSENYSVTATFTPNVGDDGTCSVYGTSPRAGLMVGYNEFCFSAFMIDYAKTNLDNNILSLTSSYTISGTTTHTSIYKSDAGEWGNLKEGITLTCVKYGALFYYYVGEGENTKLIYQEEIPTLIGAAEPGIQTTNCDVTISSPVAKYYQTAEQGDLLDYLNGTGIYVVNVENGTGGTVLPESASVESGSDLILNITPNGGVYQLDKLEIAYGTGNIKDIKEDAWQNVTADARANSVKGQYTIKNVTNNVYVRSSFARNDANMVTVTGTISAGLLQPISAATVAFENKADKTMYYSTATSSLGVYSVRIPAGDYKMYVSAKGYTSAESDVSVSGSTANKSLTLTTAIVGGSVTINGTTLASDTSAADLSLADSGIVTFKAASGTQKKTVWFSRDGVIDGDFTVSAIFTYLGGSDTDPSCGFAISGGDNKNLYNLFTLQGSSNTGFRFFNPIDGWGNRYQVRNTTNSTPINLSKAGQQAIITLKRKGNTYYLYSDQYVEGMTEATTLRGQIDGGANHQGLSSNGAYVDNGYYVPSGKIVIGFTCQENSSFRVQVVGELKKSATI